MEKLRTVGRLEEPGLLNLMFYSGFVKYSPEPITLKSGKQSHVYVFGRNDLTEHPHLMRAIAREIIHAVRLAAGDDPRSPCLIGIPTAGTPLANWAQAVDFMGAESFGKNSVRRPPILSRTMRDIKKTHGAHRSWVDGAPDTEQHLYCVVDNVVTDGQSKVETAERLKEDGYPAYDLPQIILVAREDNIAEKLRALGFSHVVILFSLRDIINGFRKTGLWTPELADAALSEFDN